MQILCPSGISCNFQKSDVEAATFPFQRSIDRIRIVADKHRSILPNSYIIPTGRHYIDSV
jgi:hypothetical protein